VSRAAQAAPARRTLLAPEVVQTSSMDCGPAVLKSLLAGHGVNASYARLREACQTDVDGTSINTLESVARDLGFDARQILVSPESLDDPARLAPAIAVIRLPNETNHFVLLWRARAGWVQIMDPAVGRRWMRASAFRASAYEHSAEVPADEWRAWAATPGFRAPLERRLARLGVQGAAADELFDRALADATWRGIAALDAAERMTRALVRSGALRRGRIVREFLPGLVERAATEDLRTSTAIPAAYWEVRPTAPRADGSVRLSVRGAVMVRVHGLAADPARATGTNAAADDEPAPEARPHSRPGRPGLSPELRAALDAPRLRPGAALWSALRADGLFTPGAAAAALFLASLVVLTQALVFRGLLDLFGDLALPEQRTAAAALLVAFLAAATALELPTTALLFRFGRRVEGRLRVRLQSKLPHLSDRALRSIPTSDLAERAHSLLMLRGVASLGGRLLRSSFQLVLTALGLIWLDRSCAPWALLAIALGLAFPIAFQRALGERELRVRSHRGALARFYLDALLGLVPARTHGAGRALRREHEGLLCEWVRAGARLLRAGVLVEGLQALLGFGIAAGLVLVHLGGATGGGEVGGVLLFAYWALALPALCEELAGVALQIPGLKNATTRVLEPLSATEESARPPESEDAGAPTDEADPDGSAEDAGLATDGAVHLAAAGGGGAATRARLRRVADDDEAEGDLPRGARIDLRGVAVRAGGHTLLSEIDLAIEPGTHVAVVGPSGAGKSTLLALLLGWHRPAAGALRVDGRPLDGAALTRLRRATAWVDPGAQLWNRSLLDNVRYGSHAAPGEAAGAAIAGADLVGTLERLPAGLATPLGEGGGLLSGGEGQRVRLARALVREHVRLALLDEPFRGLDRSQRGALLARARERWRGATLLCVTHDVEETLAFDRVVVVDRGRVVECAPPSELAGGATRYAALLAEERAVRAELWNAAFWRRLRMTDGRLTEEPAS